MEKNNTLKKMLKQFQRKLSLRKQTLQFQKKMQLKAYHRKLKSK